MLRPNNEDSTDQGNSMSYSVRFWQTISGLLAVGLVVVVVLGVGYELGQRSGLDDGGVKSEQAVTQVNPQALLADIIPTGVPSVYGSELDISYDDVSPYDPESANQTIEILSQIDRTVELSGSQLDRYIDILYRQHGGMSCEFCCGAQSIIFENGEPACACEHSFAMRGLTKYLITEHGQDLSDEEILTEVGKWKVLFFPDIHAQKASVMKEIGLTPDYIGLTSNTNRGLEEGVSGGGMIGDC